MTSPNPQTPVSTSAGETAATNLADGVSLDSKTNTNKRLAGVFSVLGQAINNDQGANDNAKQDKEDKKTADAADVRGSGVCHNGFEFIVTYNDAGDPVSTEAKYFYDKACTELARDALRTWVPGASSGSETVTRTASDYALHNSTPISVRDGTLNYSNATFDKLGYTEFGPGFDLEASSQLKIGTTKSISSDLEMVMEPAASGSNVNDYCTDSAGFNTIPVAKLNEEFGWSGGALGSPVNTRTQLSRDSATWSSVHTGTAFEGASGALSINVGSPNTACPIAAPDYTLVGGTSEGNYTIPITVTFERGVIADLTVTDASLHNGDTLNVSTNKNVLPASVNFINGKVTSGAATVATFNVNAFGHGVLTVTKTGNQYVIIDWHVVQ
ncbi:MAG: hypothetical protein JO092_00875 [Candidatus Eremiobacteraeota bacterium]|nr:hypothetical protein [Candidatus Eremiobacteraeota bacterium]